MENGVTLKCHVTFTKEVDSLFIFAIVKHKLMLPHLGIHDTEYDM